MGFFEVFKKHAYCILLAGLYSSNFFFKSDESEKAFNSFTVENVQVLQVQEKNNISMGLWSRLGIFSLNSLSKELTVLVSALGCANILKQQGRLMKSEMRKYSLSQR